MNYFDFLKSFFGNDPSQYVESSDWEGFKTHAATAVKDGTMTKEQVKVAMATFFLVIVEKAKDFVEIVESSIELTPSDKLNSKPHEVKVVQTENTNKPENVREERTYGD